MKLKTAFWDSNTNTQWREKAIKIIDFTNMIALANGTVGAIIGNWGLMIGNAVVLIIGFTMKRTKKKWEKENDIRD